MTEPNLKVIIRDSWYPQKSEKIPRFAQKNAQACLDYSAASTRFFLLAAPRLASTGFKNAPV